ncbi:MAG: hypothetical protein AAGF20_05210 [Pseudomonadota bacterium]
MAFTARLILIVSFAIMPVCLAKAAAYSLDRQPTPAAVMEVVNQTCLPAQAEGRGLETGLPDAVSEGLDNDVDAGLSTSPLPGTLWSVQTLETPIVIGDVTGKPGSCQILATSPFGNIVTEAIVMALQTGPVAFEEFEANELAPGIAQVRMKHEDRIFIDILTYGANSGRPTTVHLILQ